MQDFSTDIIEPKRGSGDKREADGALNWKHFPGGAEELYRAPVLLSGNREAILIDGGWTFRGGRAIAEAIRAAGKTLSTIFVSESDPEYYFNLLSIVTKFPRSRAIAAPSTIDAILGSVHKHFDMWKPYLRDNGPRAMADIVLPQRHTDSTLTLEGNVIEIVEARGLPDCRYLYVSTLDAVFGGSMLFDGLHVWTADASTTAQRAAWIAELDVLAERNPQIVVPGHMASNASCDASAIAFTRDYLLAFEEECAKASSSEALIGAMSCRYPDAEMRIALAIGAKVAKGEMNWTKRSTVRD